MLTFADMAGKGGQGKSDMLIWRWAGQEGNVGKGLVSYMVVSWLLKILQQLSNFCTVNWPKMALAAFASAGQIGLAQLHVAAAAAGFQVQTRFSFFSLLYSIWNFLNHYFLVLTELKLRRRKNFEIFFWRVFICGGANFFKFFKSFFCCF